MPKQRLCRKQDPDSKEITILGNTAITDYYYCLCLYMFADFAIDDLSGTVQPGEYLAIIGASGNMIS